MTRDEVADASREIAERAEARHTPEPWDCNSQVNQTRETATGELIAETNGRTRATEKANARRIVACANYCIGLDWYQLLSTAEENIGDLEHRIAELEAIGANDFDEYEQRLAALERVAEAAEEYVAYYSGQRRAQLGSGQASRSLDKFRSALPALDSDGGE